MISSIFRAACKYSKGYRCLFDINYGAETNDPRQQADLYIPHHNTDAMVILVHGGGWRSRGKEDMSYIAHRLAKNGLHVLNINYRFAPKWRHPAPIEDIDAALAYLKTNQSKLNINIKKVGLWGYSSGGHSVCYYALSHEDEIAAVVSGGAPYDFTWYKYSPYLKPYMGEYRDKMPEAYRSASPARMIKKSSASFFLYHAIGDELVEHAQMAAFEDRLNYFKVPVETHSVKRWGHKNTFIFSLATIEKGILFLKTRMRLM